MRSFVICVYRGVRVNHKLSVNFNLPQREFTVKNYRNFTDPVTGNCDKKSTGNREFTGKCPYILYINGQFTVLLRIFRKFKVN